MNIHKSKTGFTLIEVVLVLAIGGLIFLLAFLAFRQVSTNRRDTQRRKDADRILAEIQNYKSDRNGADVVLLTEAKTSTADNDGVCAPTGANVLLQAFYDFSNAYMCKNGKFYSPSDSNYTTVAWDSTAALTKDQIRVRTSFMFVSTPVLAPNCKGTGNLPLGSVRVEIGMEKSTVCREAAP